VSVADSSWSKSDARLPGELRCTSAKIAANYSAAGHSHLMCYRTSRRDVGGRPFRLLRSIAMHDGYTELPAGKLANIVTYLEMRTPPPVTVATPMSEFAVRRVEQPDLAWYRKLYREIGEPWLWFSRLRLSDDKLRAILHDPAVDVFALSNSGSDQGLLELDRRGFPEIELAFLGVTPALIGKGAGRALLAHCLPLAWEHKTGRVWLHTCTSDHPSALSFYMKFGFLPYKRAIEIADDPRLAGEIPRSAAPHIPII
jgi:GNAT superfamily N-acetyltransferase